MSEPLDLVQQWLQRSRSDLVGSHGAIVGVDVGSYGLRAVLADLSGTQVQTASRDLPQGEPDDVVAAAIDLTRHLIEQGQIGAQQLVRIGLGFGGPVDSGAGVTRVSHRTGGWEGYPLADRFEDAFDAAVLLDNDANLIALAEATCGAGRDTPNLFYLHLSSGVGGGVVIDRRVYHGVTGTAGEVGHAIVRYDGPPCSCGARGHLESYVSIDGLLRRANELGLRTDDLHALFADGDAGQQTINEATELLGTVLSNVVSLLDPQMMVVGGIVPRLGGEPLFQSIDERLQAALSPTMRRPIPVLPSTFGPDGVAIGALALAECSLRD